MKIKGKCKLKTALLTSIIALAVNSSVHAYDYNIYSTTEHDFSKNFSVLIGTQGTSSTEGSTYNYYLYWAAVDTIIENKDAPMWGDVPNKAVLKGGNWYLLTSESAIDDWESQNYTLLGNGGISEDELQQAIDDAIHHVEGDMTVAGSQEVTGDQQVDGSQTVNGGQTVSGGQTHNLKSRVTL